jgi:predicted metal-dependent hydrolase
MNFFRFGFVIGMSLAVVISLLGDRATFRRHNLRRSWRLLRTSPVLDPKIWAKLKDYNRPDFHPDDSDTTLLVESWRSELFGQHGTLNDKLIGVAAT